MDTERRKFTINALGVCPKDVVSSYRRIAAVDKSNFGNIRRASQILDDLMKGNAKLEWFLCIFLSHLKAILTFHQKGKGRVGLIMEDDADLLWSKIDWKGMIRSIERDHPKWQVIKVYRNFNKIYQEDPGLCTPYLKANKNSGLVAYLVNRSALDQRLAHISQLGFVLPELNGFDPTALLDHLRKPNVDSEKLIYTWVFDPRWVLQLNVPLVGHTYHFISSKIAQLESSGINRANLLNDKYATFLLSKRPPLHAKGLKLELFDPKYHPRLKEFNDSR